jgi:signal recognition particle receptor subunit alpha
MSSFRLLLQNPADDPSTKHSSETPSKRKAKAKTKRTWGDAQPTEIDMDKLDYSTDKLSQNSAANGDAGNIEDIQALVDQTSLGSRNRDGLYEVKDWQFTKSDGTDILADVIKPLEKNPSSLGTLGSLFARLTGSKVLTGADLQPVLEGMKQHLMKKNVAMDIAEKVCEGVGETLVGKKVGGFESECGFYLSICLELTRPRVIVATTAAVRKALSTSITRILTPKTSTDLLLSIRTKLSSPLPSSQQRMPYSITFVGVNGVGKSTNLSKVCFWLIQNGFRVLIAACDTFRSVNLKLVLHHGSLIPSLSLATSIRSGAVEQLRVHVRNLSMLGVNGAADSKGRVELYEKGYGKDAANIAREALAYGLSSSLRPCGFSPSITFLFSYDFVGY